MVQQYNEKLFSLKKQDYVERKVTTWMRLGNVVPRLQPNAEDRILYMIPHV